jgi:transmembrane sensor
MRNKKERQRLKEEFTHEVTSGKKTLPQETSVRLLNALHVKIAERARQMQDDESSQPAHNSPSALIRSAWFRWSAAAMVLLLAGFLWRSHRASSGTTASSAATIEQAMITRSNTDSSDLHLSLPDGSAVVLSPGSFIRYCPAFEPRRRNIFLSGKALFDVAADPTRAFTVCAGEVNTTALGTRFLVNTLTPGKVQVHLLQGKVVVRPSDSSLAMNDVYLEPGQQLIIDRRQQQFAVTEYPDSTASAAVPQKKRSNPVGNNRTSTNSSILEFDQEPLPEVLTAIGRKYGVTFRLKGHGFNTIQVTGKFLASDSLSSVLSMLGALHGLSFTERNDTIVVFAAHRQL